MSMRALVLAVALVAIVTVAAATLLTGTAVDGCPPVERLADRELVRTEVPLRGTMAGSAADVAAIPRMRTMQLLGHFLSNAPLPGGTPLIGEELDQVRQQVETELSRLFSSDIANRRTFDWLDIRRVPPAAYPIPPGSTSSGLRKYAESLEPEILYFWPLKLDAKYKLQILGQPGEFVSIFIGSDKRPDDVWALAVRVAPFLAGQTYTEANVEHKDYTVLRKNEFLRVICGDRSYGTRHVTVNGKTTVEVDPRHFFGISIDVDLKKIPPV